MSDFKFSCPDCGHDIVCEAGNAGKPVVCPGCHATLAVPHETAVTTDVSLPTENPPEPSVAPAPTVQRTSRLAVASLVCSLLSLITCISWLPGIICGHLAKSRLRRDPLLKGSGLATVGLVISYLVFFVEVGTAAVWIWSISTAVKRGYENVRHDLATNQILVMQTQMAAQTQSTTVSNDNKSPEPAMPATISTPQPQNEPTPTGWTSDIGRVSFPDHPASGKLHGMDFAVKTTSFRNGDLRIRSENGIQLDIFHLGASIEGHSYEIQSVDGGSANPRVKMTWNEGEAVQTATFNEGYGMKLQFDRATNRMTSGKIYLCFPDNSKSYVAGTFQVRLPKPQPRSPN